MPARIVPVLLFIAWVINSRHHPARRKPMPVKAGVVRAGERTTKQGSPDTFTGTVFQDPVITANSPSRLGGSEEHTSELQSPYDLVCRLLREKKNNKRSTPPP